MLPYIYTIVCGKTTMAFLKLFLNIYDIFLLVLTKWDNLY